MKILSEVSKIKKIKFFLEKIPKDSEILEVGCGDYWLGNYLKKNNWKNYVGLDISLPADVVGSIKNWEKLGFKKSSFDFIIAFEVLEHIDIIKECYELLKPGGCLFLTTPLPCMDWFLKILETLGLNQKRTSDHCNLTYVKNAKFFEDKKIKYVAFLSQWAILKKTK